MNVLGTPASATEVSPLPDRGMPRSSLLQRKMPGLDVLRGVAILAVVCYHGLRWNLPPAASISPGVHRMGQAVSAGWLGVNLFFVLSGFLITGILLDTRSRGSYWHSFYLRRVLRILPLYLVTLLALTLLFGFNWRVVLVCLLFLANYGAAFHVNIFGPLWSLAVEEQFYLFWPLLVRRMRLRTLGILCAISILVSPFLRFMSAAGHPHMGDPGAATWLITDNLGFGAVIAIFLRTRAATLPRVRALSASLGVGGLLLLAIGWRMHLLYRVSSTAIAFQFEPFLFLFTCLLLLSLQFGGRPLVFKLTGPLRFFGYISYGMYLSHMFFFLAYDKIHGHFFPPPAVLTPQAMLLRFALPLPASPSSVRSLAAISRNISCSSRERWQSSLPEP